MARTQSRRPGAFLEGVTNQRFDETTGRTGNIDGIHISHGRDALTALLDADMPSMPQPFLEGTGRSGDDLF